MLHVSRIGKAVLQITVCQRVVPDPQDIHGWRFITPMVCCDNIPDVHGKSSAPTSADRPSQPRSPLIQEMEAVGAVRNYIVQELAMQARWDDGELNGNSYR